MGLLSGLFGKDPTSDWPAPAAQPAIDLERHAIGPLKLGDPVESARPLGRPQKRRNSGPGCVLLEYGTYNLEFRDGRLACVHFDVEGAGKVVVGGFTLSGASTPLDAKAWFGEPTSDSQDSGLRWLDYERGEATLALEFDAGKLDCVQLYARGWA